MLGVGGQDTSSWSPSKAPDFWLLSVCSAGGVEWRGRQARDRVGGPLHLPPLRSLAGRLLRPAALRHSWARQSAGAGCVDVTAAGSRRRRWGQGRAARPQRVCSHLCSHHSLAQGSLGGRTKDLAQSGRAHTASLLSAHVLPGFVSASEVIDAESRTRQVPVD